jgi:pimeloyl-ACP methyl ester carboxylesterase
MRNVESERWTLTTADGFIINVRAMFPEASGPVPCVILAHMLGRDLGTWREYQSQLIEMGLASVAYDLRGHGESLRKTGTTEERRFPWEKFSAEDWKNAWMDVQAVLKKVKEDSRVDSERIGIEGGSIGGNVAVIALSRLDDLKCGVALSPSFQYKDVSTREALENLSGRPLLVYSSKGDQQSYRTASRFREVAGDSVEFVGMEGSTHGTNLLAEDPEVVQRTLEFLETHLSRGKETDQ